MYQGSPPTAFFIFLPTPTGARIIAPGFGILAWPDSTSSLVPFPNLAHLPSGVAVEGPDPSRVRQLYQQISYEPQLAG